MNLQETIHLLDKLNSIGAKHFKSGDLEVSLGGEMVYPGIKEPAKPPQPEPAYSPENTEKAHQLLNLMKMSAEELANQIFPEGA